MHARVSCVCVCVCVRDRWCFVLHHGVRSQWSRVAPQILMDMTYSDVTSVRLKGGTLEFRPMNPLAHYGDNYQPLNRRHVVAIGLGSPADVEAVQRQVLIIGPRDSC